ncbi:MAG TPA: glycosyltransferase [Bacteroidales bacterium]|jgi:glycosyltransferase involved in cell wall biosynthesis|nr:glycosyltransferase [Bacteroidales bacterium]
MVSEGKKLKILFVSSGKMGDVGYVVKNQGESLVRHGIHVDYLTISSGLKGYIRAVRLIHRKVNAGGYDLIHAHYSLSAFAASLAGRFPLVVSLMGSDAWQGPFFRMVIKFLAAVRWRAVIVKTREMKARLGLDKAYIIPNGVDTDRFTPGDRDEARKALGISLARKIIVFIAGENRSEKNLPLAQEAVALLNDDSVELLHVHDVDNSMIPFYLNAADLLLLTSVREGGVNVIKEAMACNCPFVATDVGDIREVAGETEGCYITDQSGSEIAVVVRQILNTGIRSHGRKRIFELGLNSESVALKISEMYTSICEEIRK